ncbi:MAG: response regulator [Anaerolineales bacterium]|nr:response regulator [Anaerolineales bacterium]
MPGFEQRAILLIDDDPLIRRIVTRALSATGYQVAEASSGTEGLALAFKNPPDLILLDVMMPGMDGFQVCAALRQNSLTANVPVLMLTALDQTDSKVRGLQTGADDYITKPFNLDELQTRIEAHLRRSERDLGANPLTILPGNIAIEHTLRQRLATTQPLAVLYIDLTNFKEYNDECGWLKGDEIIRMLARQIVDTVRKQGNPDDFIGHIGGDDFVVMSTPARAEPIAQMVITRFDVEIQLFYPAEVRARGYIETVDRRGNPFRAPIVSVAVAIVTNEQSQFHHPGQVAARAAELKKYVKSLPGSQYAFDRRRK